VGVDLNTAIDAYSQSFGNRLEPLRALCDDDATAEKLGAEIGAVQEAIIDLVRERAGEDGLPMDGIVQVGREYVCAADLPINECGLQALMRYVVWYCRHEGYLQR
jgi:hypothetical protein